MDFRDRHALHPCVFRLEERMVLSSIIASEITSSPPIPSALTVANSHDVAAAASVPATSSTLSGFTAYSGNTGGVGTGSGLNNNTSSPLLGDGFPTPAELNRESYHASFIGEVYTGPGRFTNQGTTYFYRGLGGSNFFLHGDFDMAVVTPADSTAAFYGELVANDKSTNSAGIQGLVLTASRTAVDSQGRPTQLTFTADPNIYSGIFFVEAGQGTVNIKYGARNSVKVTITGLIYTSGLTSPLVNQDLYARDGRPVPYHPATQLTTSHKG